MPVLAKNYTVIAPDMKGYFDSEKPENGYAILTLANDFSALIKQTGIPCKVITVAQFFKRSTTLLEIYYRDSQLFNLVYLSHQSTY